MARKSTINAVQTAAVESMRNRVEMSAEEFSEALGLGRSTYGEMKRENRVPLTVALAAETLVRRQAPGAAAELIYLTRIVRGVPVITVLDGDVRTMTLDGERYLLIPAEERRRDRAQRDTDPPLQVNGAGPPLPIPPPRPVAEQPDGFGNG